MSILAVRELLYKTLRKDTRTELNTYPHFVPLNIKILEVLLQGKLEGISVQEFSNHITRFIKSTIPNNVYARNGRVYTSPSGTQEVTLNNLYTYTPAIVYTGAHIQGVLFRNYKAVGATLFTPLLNKQLIKYLKVPTSGFKGTNKFDISHTNMQHDGQSLANVPNMMGAAALEDVLTSSNVSIGTFYSSNPAEASKLISSILDKVQAAREEFLIHTNYGSMAEATLSKDFKDSLLSLNVNIVLITDSEDNQYYFNRLHETPFINELTRLIKLVHFSNNIEEEIATRVTNILKGKPTTNTKKSVKIPGNIKKIVTKAIKSIPVKSPVTRNLQGQFYSLANLQMLINTHLQDVVSANMGDEGYPGGQRRILNYRTGRFAASVKVERLSQSREGAISAFYNYMRYPYQTFEPGFKMGSPKTRDPKLLIAKSIREIAATKVGNRLRAVLV